MFVARASEYVRSPNADEYQRNNNKCGENVNLDENKREHEPTKCKIKYIQPLERFQPFDRDDDVSRLLFFLNFCIEPAEY